MEISDRFASRWDEWDARVRNNAQANAFLRTAKDEDLLELLAGGSTKDRKYERDIVTTEIQNRLASRNRDHPLGADEVLDAARVAYEAAASGQKAIHTAEAILKASGDLELGTSVSAAAYVSLDSTKVALDAARAHAAELQSALAQSRVAERLLEDAAQAALEVVEKAAAGAKRVEQLGHVAEARAAREAAELIRSAAEVAAKKLHHARNDAHADPSAASPRAEAEAAHEATELIRKAAEAAVKKLNGPVRRKA